MKKTVALVLSVLLIVALLAGCGQSKTEPSKLRVAATAVPHAEILEVAKEVLAKQGIELEIIVYTDYVQPNLVVDSGEVDANYFQHTPYLTDFNASNGTHVVSAGLIHYEPLGLYAGKTASVDALSEGAEIAIPNDATNGARALLLLQQEGILKLKDDVGVNATVYDIVDNPLNVKIVEIDAAQVASVLKDVDLAVINGNYALDAGLNAGSDALAVESAEGEAAQYYGNLLGVKEGRENDPGIQALLAALQSQEVKDFINSTYNGAVVPIF